MVIGPGFDSPHLQYVLAAREAYSEMGGPFLWYTPLMDWTVAGEVARASFWGFVFSAPLKYYLLKNHISKPTQNAAVMVVWGLVVGHYLFDSSRKRLEGTGSPETEPPWLYVLGGPQQL